MHHYFLQLGFVPKLANLELATYLSRHKIKYSKHPLSLKEIIITSKKVIDASDLIHSLGGTIRLSTRTSSCSQQQLASHLVQILATQPGKISFSVTAVNFRLDQLKLCQEIKTQLKPQGKNARFLIPTKKYQDPLVIHDQKVTELLLIQTHQGNIDIFTTRAVTNPRQWQYRDRHRPVSDPKSGMMPPKVARMLVNISFNQAPTPSSLFMDPFCGSGTLLAEALILNASVQGIDISTKAIQDTQQNLQWLGQHHDFSGSFHLLNADITNIDPTKLAGPPTAVAFEGYLGPPKLTPSKTLPSLVSELASLYQHTFAHLIQILPPQTKVVAALPRHHGSQSVKMLQHLIDTCENSGYTLLVGPLMYSKPGAKVQRAIYVLETSKL